jgi:dipeptidyl aminopeptidase/acylaminoacyl peptidase
MYSAGRLHLDSLLGPLPQAAAIYRERSPLRFADRIRRPLAVFQGEIDKVVPRHQSDAIEHFYRTVEALLRQHVLFA